MIKICKNGHQFKKSSDCPVCPQCEKENQNKLNEFSVLSAPARRALKNAGIVNIENLSNYSTKDLIKLHGLGPSSIPKIKKLLEIQGLALKK
jgi:DNA-directed RNA polymerase alpha subunit